MRFARTVVATASAVPLAEGAGVAQHRCCLLSFLSLLVLWYWRGPVFGCTDNQSCPQHVRSNCCKQTLVPLLWQSAKCVLFAGSLVAVKGVGIELLSAQLSNLTATAEPVAFSLRNCKNI